MMTSSPGISVSQGIAGVVPEPVGGFHTAAARDRALEVFCAAVWDRHEVRGRRSVPRMWPSSGTFTNNWPLLATDLLIGAWKISEAESSEESAELDVELLHPPAPPERDWRAVYADELASNPGILEDLERGGAVDGPEYVLERAGLTLSERTVLRGWMMGDDVAHIAADLSWRTQTVMAILYNARHRLEDPSLWSRRRNLGRDRARERLVAAS